MKYGPITNIPTEYVLRAMNPGEKVNVPTSDGKNLEVEFVGTTGTNAETGMKKVIFLCNGALRTVEILDETMASNLKSNEKADPANPK